MNEAEPNQLDIAQALLAKTADTLAEHFDAVQILACKLLPDGSTVSFRSGSGLFTARVGMAHAFIERDQATTMNEIARDASDDDGGD